MRDPPAAEPLLRTIRAADETAGRRLGDASAPWSRDTGYARGSAPVTFDELPAGRAGLRVRVPGCALHEQTDQSRRLRKHLGDPADLAEPVDVVLSPR